MHSEAAKKLEEFLNLGTGYSLIREMQEYSRKAEEDDAVLNLLMEMAASCLDMEQWKKNGIFCSSLISAIIHTKKPKSMKFMLKFIEKLPENTNMKVVDFVSGVLPLYGRIISGPVKEISASGKNPVLRAIGIQTLCKMALEQTLEHDDEEYLLKSIDQYADDVYLTSHIVELARTSIAGRRKQEENLDEFLDGLLVES